MGYKVLLADDSITVQKIVKLSLTEEGIEVVAFGNGEQAVQQIEAIQPDLIMADVFMPGKDGYEVCEYVKAHPQFKHIPVILLVHAFEPFDPERAKKVCADHQLTKPFQSIRILVTTVQELLARPQIPADVQSQLVEIDIENPVNSAGQGMEQLMPSMAEMGLMAPPVPAISYAMPELPSTLSVASDFSPDDLLPALDFSESVWPASSPSLTPSSMMVSSMTTERFAEEDILDLPEQVSLAGPSVQTSATMVSLMPSVSTNNSDDLLLSVSNSEPKANLPEGTTLIDSSEQNLNLSLDVGLGMLMPLTSIETIESCEQNATMEAAPPITTVISEPTSISEGAVQIPESVIEDIVNRVIQKLSTTAIQDVAWEVVPEMAELLIRKQIAQQKQLSH